MPAKFSLRFLGTSSQPSLTRNYSAILLKHAHHAALIDCGEGTQRQILSKQIGGEEKASSIRTIFVTHLHVDHVSGIVPLMMTIMGPSGAASSESDGNEPRLVLYGPFGLRALIRTSLSLSYAGLNGKYVVHELHWPEQSTKADGAQLQDTSNRLAGAVKCPPRTIPQLPLHDAELEGRDIIMTQPPYTWPSFAEIGEGSQLVVSAAPILHRCPCVGYVFEEKPSARPLAPETLARLDANGRALLEQRGIKHPRSLLGTVLKRRESVTLPDGTVIHPPPLDLAGRKVCILGDTFDATGGFSDEREGMTGLASGCDVLVHESTNVALPPKLLQTSGAPPKKVPTVEETLEKARDRGHATPQVAGAFAARIKARQLLLNHFSVRYDSPPPWIRDSFLPPVDYSDVGPQGSAGSAEPRQQDGQSGPSSQAPEQPRTAPPFSWAERTARVMKEIEDQATEAWRQGVGPEEGPTLPRAIATWDGFEFDVLTQDEREAQDQARQSGNTAEAGTGGHTAQGAEGHGRGAAASRGWRGHARGRSSPHARGRGEAPRGHTRGRGRGRGNVD